MAIITDIYISGIKVEDVESCIVDKEIGVNDSASSFSMTLNNSAAYNTDKYGIGNEVKIYAGLDRYVDFGSQMENFVVLGSELIGSQFLTSGTSVQLYSGLDTNLLSYYSLNGHTKDLVGSNHLTNNGATYTSEGKVGGGYVFDGINDYIVSNANIGISGSSPRTISFWASTSSAAAEQTFLKFGTAANYQMFVIGTYNGVYNLPTYSHDYSTGYSVDTNLHHHVVTFDGVNTIKWIIDGTTRMTADTTGYGINTGASVLTISDSSTWPAKPLTGKIDEIGIWSRVLTSTEITELYNSGAGLTYYDGEFIETSDLRENLISYYALDETSGTTVEDSHGSNDGTNYNCTVNQTGKLGKAYSFNGSTSYIEPNQTGLDITNGVISFGGWIYRSGVNGMVIARDGATASTMQYRLWIMSDGKASGGVGNYANEAASDEAIPANTWTHVLVTCDGTTVKMYVGGVLQTKAGAFSTQATSNKTYIGKRRDSSSDYFYTGRLDELGIWTRTLSSAEVQRLYNSNSGLAYPLDDIGSTVVTGSIFFNDYALNISGTYVSKAGSELIGSQLFSGTTYIQDYGRIYTGSVVSLGSQLIGSQLINGSYYNNYDLAYNGSVLVYNGSGIVNYQIFTGILEDISYAGTENNERITLNGRDYTAQLMDRTVEPEVYTNLQTGSIIRDLLYKYTDSIGIDNVSATTGKEIQRISFNQIPVFDAIKQLADLDGYIFYVDEDKDLFYISGTSANNIGTFDNTNVLSSKFKEQRDTIYNKIWVYGDRYLDAFTQSFKAGSPMPLGSEYTLLYNPHNTEIYVNGSVIQPGAIENMSYTLPSNVKYLVNYNDKKITFVSGTAMGNNVPQSGANVIINYYRSLPIVKVADIEESKLLYGERVKVIIDKNIKDPSTAEQILIREIEKNPFPKNEGSIKIEGLYDINPGDICTANLPYHNIENEDCNILSCKYDFNKRNCLAEQVLDLKINEKLPDLTDSIKKILLDLRKTQGGDIDTTDIITRYHYDTAETSISILQERVRYKESGTDVWADHYVFNTTGSHYEDFQTNNWLFSYSGCLLAGSIVQWY